MVFPGIISSLFAFLFITWLHTNLLNEPIGEDLFKAKKIGGKLDFLAKQIKDGAKAFLAEEYRWLTYFVLGMALVLLIIFSAAPDGDADASQVFFLILIIIII